MTKFRDMLMSLAEFRDGVMNRVSINDVLTVESAIGERFVEADRSKYMNPFKYVIWNRKWMLDMIEKAYSFVLLGYDLAKISNLNTGRATHIFMGLIVIKDEDMVPCTNDFIDTSLFLDGPFNKRLIEDITVNTSKHATRFVRTLLDKLRITIVMRTMKVDPTLPMIVDFPNIFERLFSANYTDKVLVKMPYLHMDKDKYAIECLYPKCDTCASDLAMVLESMLALRVVVKGSSWKATCEFWVPKKRSAIPVGDAYVAMTRSSRRTRM